MEIEEAWAPIITESEIKTYGVLLDDSLLVEPDMGSIQKLKIYCKLYYLKHRDRFVTVINNFVTMNDVPPIQVVTDSIRIDEFRRAYLKETPTESKDMFVEYDTSKHTSFASDFDLNDVKKYGIFLETFSGHDMYYVEVIDAFVQVVDGKPHSKFQSPALRKKYDIPYQDERFDGMIL